MSIQATGKIVTRAELADMFGVEMNVIRTHLVQLGLVTVDPDGTEIATSQAERSGLWAGGRARFLGGGDWDTGLIPALAERLGIEPASREQTRKHRAARTQGERAKYVARLRSDQALVEEAKRVREMELSRMTGAHRVALMITEREATLRAQCPDDAAWKLELTAQRSRALSLARECSFTGDYPDFETELVDRVIFTLDEQMAAARAFVAQGRAVSIGPASRTPAVAGRRA